MYSWIKPVSLLASVTALFAVNVSTVYADDIPDVISVNFYPEPVSTGKDFSVPNDDTEVPGLSGRAVFGRDWTNICVNANESNIVDEVEVPVPFPIGAGATLEWSSDSLYRWNWDGKADQFMKGYLNMGQVPTFKIHDIPYEYYDLIVYFASDHSLISGDKWSPVTVNGSQYTYDSENQCTVHGGWPWGHPEDETTAFGVNAIRISGLSGSELQFFTSNWTHDWVYGYDCGVIGPVAAFQIVQLHTIEVSGLITSRQINSIAGGSSEVYLKVEPGSTIRVFNSPMTCGTVHIVSPGSVKVETFDNLPPVENSIVEQNLAKFDASGIANGCLVHTWKPLRRTLSINWGAFTDINWNNSYVPSDWSFYGGLGGEEIPAATWNNMSSESKSGTDFSPIVWDGELATTNIDHGITMSWDKCKNWHEGLVTDNQPYYRASWLNPDDEVWEFQIANIPFEKYDLILYFSHNTEGAIDAIPINDKFYMYDTNVNATVECSAHNSWGERICKRPDEIGVNVLVITNLTDTTLNLRRQNDGDNYWHQPLCAIQLIEYCPPLKKRLFGLEVRVR